MKAKTNAEIVLAIFKDLQKYPFFDIIEGMGSLHLTYLHSHQDYIIQTFEKLTDRNYALGCIMPTKESLGLGLIVLQDGFRNYKN